LAVQTQKRRFQKNERPKPEGLEGVARNPGEALGDFAARILREAIRTGKLRPGGHLREADFADWLGISRTPVREAFHTMISEGLLVAGPWNGAKVAELDNQQLVELYAVREVLEGAAASFAAMHASRAEIENLFRIAEQEAASADDPDRLVQINSDLHSAIYEASHNRYLLRSLHSVVDTLGLVRHSSFVLKGSIEQARQEHLGILEAIRAGDAALAGQRAREHVGNALVLRLELQRMSSSSK